MVPQGPLHPHSAQPIVYEHISSMVFVDGYITVMGKESPRNRAIMLTHLQELMEDGEKYGWPAARAYHAAWLQHIE